MADYAPPPGPPPPQVPAGWKAVWNDQYKEWFYVNTYTKESTWTKPTEAARPSGDGPPAGAPPAYDHSGNTNTLPAEKSSNPYRQQGESDEALARRLQAEENARSKSSIAGARGESDGYYGGSSQQQIGQSSSQYTPQGQYGSQSYGQPQTQDQGAGKKGFFSKLMGSSSRPPQGSPYQSQPGYGAPQGYGQQGYGYPPPQAGYGYPPQAGYGGYPPQQYAQQRPQKSGMGMGGVALGAGAGLLGGVLIGDAIADHDQSEYNQGYENGQDDNGGDYGGDDGGGGDF